MKYTKSSDTSATWRPDDDQRRSASINGEGIEETPAFAKASAVANALADRSAGKEGTEGKEGGRQDPARDGDGITGASSKKTAPSPAETETAKGKRNNGNSGGETG